MNQWGIFCLPIEFYMNDDKAILQINTRIVNESGIPVNTGVMHEFMIRGRPGLQEHRFFLNHSGDTMVAQQ